MRGRRARGIRRTGEEGPEAAGSGDRRRKQTDPQMRVQQTAGETAVDAHAQGAGRAEVRGNRWYHEVFDRHGQGELSPRGAEAEGNVGGRKNRGVRSQKSG